MHKRINWLEVLVPAGLALASSAVFLTAIDFPTNAKIFPVGLSGLLIILCLVKIATTFGIESVRPEFELRGENLKRFLIIVPAAVILFLLLDLLGMYPAMLLFFFVLFRLLGDLPAGRNATLSVGLTVGLYLVFDTLLGLPTPEGILGMFSE